MTSLLQSVQAASCCRFSVPSVYGCGYVTLLSKRKNRIKAYGLSVCTPLQCAFTSSQVRALQRKITDICVTNFFITIICQNHKYYCISENYSHLEKNYVNIFINFMVPGKILQLCSKFFFKIKSRSLSF